MERYALKDEAYIPIRRGGAASYGGSQMWFDRHSRAARERAIQGWGCGIVAACDLLLYLARQDNSHATALNASLARAPELDAAAYLEYLKAFERRFCHVWEPFGILGAGLALAIDRYFHAYGLPYRARWRAVTKSETARRRAAQMLKSDIPVILSLPPVFTRRGALHLYREHPAAEGARERALQYRAFGGHFITATALETDPMGRRILTASSWGKKYRLDMDEYERHAHTPAGLLACGLVEVTPLSGPRRPARVTVGLSGRYAPQADEEK